MTDLTVKTDHKWRFLSTCHDVPAAVLAAQFDYMSDEDLEDATFFKYRGYWYDLAQFMLLNDGSAIGADFANWDAYSADSYYSGVVVRLAGDGDRIKVGTYYA